VRANQVPARTGRIYALRSASAVADSTSNSGATGRGRTPAGHWKVKSDGWNLWGDFYFGIDVGNSCGNSGTPPAEVKRLTLEYAGSTYTIRRHVTAFFKSQLEPKGDFTMTDPNKKILSNTQSSALTVTAKPANGGQDWTCVFAEGQFEELCLDHKQPCM